MRIIYYNKFVHAYREKIILSHYPLQLRSYYKRTDHSSFDVWVKSYGTILETIESS